MPLQATSFGNMPWWLCGDNCSMTFWPSQTTRDNHWHLDTIKAILMEMEVIVNCQSASCFNIFWLTLNSIVLIIALDWWHQILVLCEGIWTWNFTDITMHKINHNSQTWSTLIQSYLNLVWNMDDRSHNSDVIKV